jgi:hypothetical protein
VTMVTFYLMLCDQLTQIGMLQTWPTSVPLETNENTNFVDGKLESASLASLVD